MEQDLLPEAALVNLTAKVLISHMAQEILEITLVKVSLIPGREGPKSPLASQNFQHSHTEIFGYSHEFYYELRIK